MLARTSVDRPAEFFKFELGTREKAGDQSPADTALREKKRERRNPKQRGSRRLGCVQTDRHS